MRTLFTSDPHFGHERVAEIRGFSSTEEHDEHLCDRWRSVVGPKDTVWVLGDLGLASPRIPLAILADLPGRKHLIDGNHDASHPMHRNAHRHQRTYLEVFESVQPFARRRIRGTEVMLSHFPYERDHTTVPRHMQYRLRDEGAVLLHGHTHEAGRVNGREIHVGVDAWDFTPVPESTIADLIEGIAA